MNLSSEIELLFEFCQAPSLLTFSCTQTDCKIQISNVSCTKTCSWYAHCCIPEYFEFLSFVRDDYRKKQLSYPPEKRMFDVLPSLVRTNDEIQSDLVSSIADKAKKLMAFNISFQNFCYISLTKLIISNHPTF